MGKLDKYPDLHFHSKSGVLVVAREADGMLRMDFPRGNPASVELPEETKTALISLLGLSMAAGDALSDVQFCPATRKLFLELQGSELVFRAKTPDPERLMAIKFPSTIDVRGLCIVSKEVSGRVGHPELGSSNIASRYFSPWNGITEDPVNGSSHTALGVMYHKKFPQWNPLKCYAASSRSGVLWLEVPADSDRIYIKGFASSVLEGKLSLPE